MKTSEESLWQYFDGDVGISRSNMVLRELALIFGVQEQQEEEEEEEDGIAQATGQDSSYFRCVGVTGGGGGVVRTNLFP